MWHSLTSNQLTILALSLSTYAASAVVVERAAVSPSHNPVTLETEVVGYPHGASFTDTWAAAYLKNSNRISSIRMGPCDPGQHVSYVEIDYATLGDERWVHFTEIQHGKVADDAMKVVVEFKDSSSFAQGVTRVRLTTWKAKVGTTHHTRIGWIEFTTSKGVYACGAKDAADHIYDWQAPKDSYLWALAGTSGDALDSLKGYFISDY